MMDLLLKLKNIILQVIQDKSKLNDFNLNGYQVYAFTNENVAGYLEKLNINSINNTLTICSSGDHMLNLGVKGVRNIDLIDVNPMAEYFALGIRLPLILAYSYQEHKRVIDFLFKSNTYDVYLERKILYDLLPYMNLKYRIFFKEIFDYYFQLQARYNVPVKLMQIITTDYYFNMDEITFYNLYMRSEEYYNNLRRVIKTMNLSFKLDSIFDVASKDTYDLVIVSNAIEHTYIPECDMKKLRKYFSSLRESLTKDGMILASYIYSFYNKGLDSYDSFPIKGIDVNIRELLKEELICFDNYKNNTDAVLVLRK